MLLALAALAGSAAALHLTDSPNGLVCGTVVNAAGWPLEDVVVRARGLGPRSLDHGLYPGVDPLGTLAANTAPDGRFLMAAFPDPHVVTFVDPLSTDPVVPGTRDGARYLPAAVPTGAFVAGACGGNRLGADLGHVALTTPTAGFLEVRVHDRVGGPALAGAEVRVEVAVPFSAERPPAPDLGPLPPSPVPLPFEAREGPAPPAFPATLPRVPWRDATTDEAGIARVTCPRGAPVEVTVTLPGFLPLVARPACDAEVLPPLDGGLWRTPVTVHGEVRDVDLDAGLEAVPVTATPDQLAVPVGGDAPYRLSATSDADGTYALAVPWGDGYDVVASEAGYAVASAHRMLARSDAGTTVLIDLGLARLAFPASAVVTTYADGPAAGATVQATGIDVPDASAATLTDAEGRFTLVLKWGAYDLTVEQAGRNARTCSLTLDRDGAHTLGPDGCLRLFRDGHGAVEGLVLDDEVGHGIAGARVEVAGAVTLTGADGSFAFEAPAGTADLVVTEAGYTASSPAPVTVLLDDVVEHPDVVLTRRAVDVTFQVRDAVGGAAVDDASVCASHAAREVCGTSAADGRVTLGLPWTTRSGAGAAFDTGAYAVRAERAHGAPIYLEATCIAALAVDVAAPPGVQACRLDAAQVLATPVGPVHDAHTGAPLAGVVVEADAVGDPVPCDAPHVCRATTGPDGTALVRLPQGHSFEVRLVPDAHQAPEPVAVEPGEAAYAHVGLARTAIPLVVRILDAHTQGPVEALAVQATGLGFVCDPGVGGFVCATDTGPEGRAALVLPWGAFEAVSVAGEADVHPPDGPDPPLPAPGMGVLVSTQPAPVVEDGVALHATVASLALAPGDAPGERALRALRQASAPIEGTIEDFRGAAVPGTWVEARSERTDGFVCDPQEHDSPDATGFPDCDGVTAQAGAYQVRLPDGTRADHLWALDASAPGHFLETLEGVFPAELRDITLWPLRFDLVVEPRDAITGALLRDTVVCIKNLDAARQAASPLPPDDDCRSTGPDARPVVFPGVAWIRDVGEAADTTDRFLVRALPPTVDGAAPGPGPLPAPLPRVRAPAATTEDLGPAASLVVVPVVGTPAAPAVPPVP